jgi:D-alanyl-D-alanine carboxypeptidase
MRMLSWRVTTVVLATLILPAFVRAQSTTQSDLPPRLDAIAAEAFPAGAPGAAVLVVVDGKPILRKGYGLADVEHKRAIAPDDVFRIGSLTKQFTAVAILQLVQQGKVKLDDPITAYVPDFDMRGKTITIEHLLTHTSGVPNFTSTPDYRAKFDQHLAPRQVVGMTDGQPLEFDPGTKFKYSNTNYALLGMVIERVSGQTYADYLAEHVLKPAGTKDTAYSANDAATRPRHATGYDIEDNKPTPTTRPEMAIPFAAGALESTVDDLWSWTQALRDGKVVDAKLLERAWTPYSPSDGASNYGYGWMIRRDNGERWIAHSGGIDGFSCTAMFVPDRNLFVAILTNRMDQDHPPPDAVARQLALEALGRPIKRRTAIALDERTLEKYVGVYQLAPTFKLTITREGTRMFAQATNQSRAEIFPEAEGKFFSKIVDAQFEFKFDGGDGENADHVDHASSLVLHQNGHDVPAKRVAE